MKFDRLAWKKIKVVERPCDVVYQRGNATNKCYLRSRIDRVTFRICAKMRK